MITGTEIGKKITFYSATAGRYYKTYDQQSLGSSINIILFSHVYVCLRKIIDTDNECNSY